MWALLCLANHSCLPNAHEVFVGGTCMLRALRDLPAGKGLPWRRYGGTALQIHQCCLISWCNFATEAQMSGGHALCHQHGYTGNEHPLGGLPSSPTLPCCLPCSGEELFVSYNEDAVFVPLRRRRKALESWGFTCRCRRCLAEQELPAELVKRLEEASDPVPLLLRSQQPAQAPNFAICT